MPIPGVIDDIHEAASDPEAWSDVLHEACRRSGSASCELPVYGGPEVQHWIATGIPRDFLRAFPVADGASCVGPARRSLTALPASPRDRAIVRRA